MTVSIIIRDTAPDDFVLAIRAAQYLLRGDSRDAFLAYGDSAPTKDFYVKRNKSSITVRYIGRTP